MFYLTVDGKDIARMPVGRRVTFGLEQGEHIIGVRCPRLKNPGSLLEEWFLIERQIRVIESDETIHFYIAPGGNKGCHIDQE